ncbi:MAG: aminopeptidase P family protein [Thermoleophilaceae bacterium]|nr:aminopeptidase P family protein [Thermoleophilaceae bacterium]
MSAEPARIRRLRAAMIERELDALLVTGLHNVRYLSGFSGTNGTLAIDAERAILLTDFRYTVQAAEQAEYFEIVDAGSEPRKRIVEALDPAVRIGFDEADMRVKSYEALIAELPDSVELVPAAGAVEAIRAVKDDHEIDAIARAAMIGDSIYVSLAEEGLIGRTERDIAWRVEELARAGGASGISFPSIVAAGPHGALPHAEPRDVLIEAGQLVVLDLGVVNGGYCSDCTRTFATGPIPDAARAAYELVLEAQQQALAAVVVGAECKAVDAVARDVISAGGLGEKFGHSLGHGVGIEVHELPTLSSRSDGTLVAGNVVTVEPGVYVEGEFGVRIEDLVVVAEDGPRVLTPFAKELVTVG